MKSRALVAAAGQLPAVLLTLVLAAALPGCAIYDPRLQMPVQPPVLPAAAAPSVQNPGAIFQASSYRPFFEDHRARLIGDVLTIAIVEKVSATAKSTSSLDKGGSISGSVTALPGIKPAAFARATTGATAGNTFAGKGATENSNEFSGSITVVVREVLPNGHLLISGEKQIGVNQNLDVLRFSGQVDPRSIQPGNSVQSAQVANVRLEQRGRGQQAEAQAMGWLGRVFLSLSPI